ncbi:hypothetical protein CBR_g51046 [Chara braunii]|uniref:CobW C-terminal domain-containing protein n=1 Tax=Chara braunii TaxID=69332 RepID=A0A388K5Z7_CHABU|nr:hypothetical protein CBR_g51046 [Chara braunii]|eukprot:GBG65451.1 hypothetical protein CBR_g51046 [Chara braunii]
MAMTSRLVLSSSAASALGLAAAVPVLHRARSSSVAAAFRICRPCALTLHSRRSAQLCVVKTTPWNADEHRHGHRICCSPLNPSCGWVTRSRSCEGQLHPHTSKHCRRYTDTLRRASRHLVARSRATEVERAEQEEQQQKEEEEEEEEEEEKEKEEDTRVPVTVITGYLGSGKTTLLNYILTADHGKKIAVIENEYGEVDIDGDLVATKRMGAEDIVMLNNGCLCCTVRGDLVRMILELVRTKRDRFDHIVIETTGLANPSPVIQTFFIEDEIAMNAKLDGVVTVVDAKHAAQHIDEVKPDGVVNEAVEQIAFADRIVLNKVDLVNEKEMEVLRRRIRRINGMARVVPTNYGVVEIDYVLGVGGFDLERVEKEVQPELLEEKKKKKKEEEEGGSVGKKKAEDGGNGDLPHSHHEGGDAEAHDHHSHHHSHEEHEDTHGHDHDHHHDHDHDHVHDPGVTSVSIVCDGELDLEKINDWLGDLLQERSEDLYRMKGVLAIKGADERFVFQGVHALFEGSPDRPWGKDEKRTNRIVFIGKDLNNEELTRGFRSCLVAGGK